MTRFALDEAVIALDLEGVLAPEFWVAVAEATGVEALRRTTREEADYEALMRFRLELLDVHSIKFSEIMAVVTSLPPLDGALDFLHQLRTLASVIVVSDTFDVFAEAFLARVGRPTILCHRLLLTDDRIVGYELAGPHHKRTVIEGFQKDGRVTVAIGDSYNDLEMVCAADHGLLFRPPTAVRNVSPEVVAVDTYDGLLRCVRDALAAHVSCDIARTKQRLLT